MNMVGVQRLLPLNDVNEGSRLGTALFYAMKGTSPEKKEIVEALLQAGADVNIRPKQHCWTYAPGTYGFDSINPIWFPSPGNFILAVVFVLFIFFTHNTLHEKLKTHLSQHSTKQH
jgi:hypothetical protein